MKLDTMTIYFPQRAQAERPVERLRKIAEKRDRSTNYIVLEAITQYLERETPKR